jgi:hypothetical protein
VRLDLDDPSTFGVVDGADLVVDVADATSSRPDALARYCLERGVVFLETTSDLPAIDRMLRALRGVDGTGAAVLGAGIFTGLSNLMCKEVTSAGGRVRLGIRTSPYSGAGKGTVALMASALSTPAVSFEGGERVVHPPISAGPKMAFPSGSTPSLRMPLAETVMLPLSTGARDVAAFFAPKPSLLVYAFLLLPGFLLRARWFGRLMAGYFGVLRTKLLAGASTSTELVAEGDRGRIALQAEDGMLAGGVAIAAIAQELLARPSPARGCVLVDEVVALRPVLENLGKLMPGSITILEKFNENSSS